MLEARAASHNNAALLHCCALRSRDGDLGACARVAASPPRAPFALRALTAAHSLAQRVSSEEFRRLLQVTAQQRTTHGSVHVHALPSATFSTHPSVEVVARKRLIGKSAVVRNRVKRSLRGAARAAMAGGARRDRRYLIVARESAVTAGFEDIVADVGRALRRLGCWDPPAAVMKSARRPRRPSASAAHRRRAQRRKAPEP